MLIQGVSFPCLNHPKEDAFILCILEIRKTLFIHVVKEENQKIATPYNTLHFQACNGYKII